MINNMVTNTLFHLGQTICQFPFNDTFHQRLLVDQEVHIIVDELL